MRTRLLNMTWSNLRFNVWRSFVTMATNLPSCFSIRFLEQLLKFLVNFTLLKYVKSQRSYGFLITKELVFGFQILDLKDHFSASLKRINNNLCHRHESIDSGGISLFIDNLRCTSFCFNNSNRSWDSLSICTQLQEILSLVNPG